ncbi:MAG: 4-(cytidine 5'-diphospho)-2-C-methyl-D-erythritol kinase [Acidobacteriota bacterium]
MTAPTHLSVRCPAKVNLHLEVLGRRPDGYHELRTVFVAVGVFDELELDAAPPGELALDVIPDGAVAAGEDNLVMRAARALQRECGTDAGARMCLRKSIPVAAGLGGGSSDAAGALVGLASMWGWVGTPADLHRLAASLGADVPFFLVGGAAWGVGTGTEVRALPDLPEWWLVLLPGPEPIPTAAVYRELGAAPLARPSQQSKGEPLAEGGVPALEACRNDLEPVALRRWPEVAERLGAVRATGPALAMLSGSGGTVFGLYRDRAAAAEAGNALEAYAPIVAPVLSRAASRLL